MIPKNKWKILFENRKLGNQRNYWNYFGTILGKNKKFSAIL